MFTSVFRGETFFAKKTFLPKVIVAASSRERRERVLKRIFERRHVTARDLAEELDVSEATVRRDLKELALRGQIELVYGGATLLRNADFSFHAKGRRFAEAKRTIGKLAAQLVADRQQIFLDSGTTCFEMAPFLKEKRGLSIIVNSARMALELDSPGLEVILLGGQYRPQRMDCIGPLAIGTLEQLRGYTAFLGADGLSRDFGLAASDIESAHLNRLAVLNSRQSILLADHSKFLSPSLYKIVDWSSISKVVSNQPPDEPWRKFFHDSHIELITPDSPPVNE